MNNNNFGNVKLESYGKIIGGIVTIVTVAIPTLILGFTCLISGQLILIPFLICLLAVLMIGIVTLLQGLTVRKLVKASESGNYSIAEIDELEKKCNKLNVATLLAGFAYNFGFYLFWFGYKRSVEKGVLPGSDNIYGYVKDRTKKGKLKIHEEEAELVRTIFDMYVNNNVGATKLGHILYNEHGIKSQTGKPLAGNVIANIIRNPKYKGYFCAHKETTVDYHSQKRKKFKPEEWIVYKDNETCPPIVSEEIWDKANAILKARSKKHEKHNPGGSWSQFPLSGKMICKHDGAKFIRGTYSNKNKQGITKKIFWACSQYRKYGTAKTSGCNSPVLHYEEMIKISNNILKDIITNKEELLQEINDVINEVKRTKDYKSEIKTINDKIKKLETEKKELIQMRMRKEIDTKEYNDMKEELVRLITLAESNLKKSEEGQKQNKNQDTSLSEFKDKINNLVLKDDASVLEIVDTLFKMIYIEKIEDTDTSKKTMLHIQLNIESYENRNISLDQLSLLFRYSNRCCYCNRKLCSRK